MIQRYKHCKNGKLMSWKQGEWVMARDYEELLMENKFLRKELNWETFERKFCMLLDKDTKISSQIKLAAHIYLNGIKFLIDSSKKQIKDKPFQQSLSKEDKVEV